MLKDCKKKEIHIAVVVIIIIFYILIRNSLLYIY